MQLYRGALNQFESISPPMSHALTLPVQSDHKIPRDTGITIYVCASSFFHQPAQRSDVLKVAKALVLLTPADEKAMRQAAEMLMHVPGGHSQCVAETLLSIIGRTK